MRYGNLVWLNPKVRHESALSHVVKIYYTAVFVYVSVQLPHMG